MKRSRSRTLAATAVMTAVTALATLYLSINTGTALFTLGDAAIFLTAAFFGPLPAAFAGGVGSFIADAAVFPATMWFSLAIKAIEGALAGFGALLARRVAARRGGAAGWAVFVLSTVAAGAWMIAGYYLTNSLWWGSPEAAFANLPNDSVQAAVAVAVAAAVAPAVSKALTSAKSARGKNKNETDGKPVDVHSEQDGSGKKDEDGGRGTDG